MLEYSPGGSLCQRNRCNLRAQNGGWCSGIIPPEEDESYSAPGLAIILSLIYLPPLYITQVCRQLFACHARPRSFIMILVSLFPFMLMAPSLSTNTPGAISRISSDDFPIAMALLPTLVHDGICQLRVLSVWPLFPLPPAFLRLRPG